MIVPAFRGEVFKAVRRPANRVTIVILLVLAVGLGYVLTWVIANHPPAGRQGSALTPAQIAALKVGLHPSHLVRETLGGWASLGGVFALILGVLSQGSEYGWETVKTMYVQRPARLTMLSGKLMALALTVLVMVVGLFAVNAVASFAIAAADGASTTFPAAIDILKGLGATWLIFAFWAMLGVALATLFGQSAMAIGLGLAYGLIIEGLVFGLLGQLNSDTIKSIQELMPISNAGYLVAAFGAATRTGAAPASAPLADGPHAVVVLLVWAAGLTALTALLVRRRDVS